MPNQNDGDTTVDEVLNGEGQSQDQVDENQSPATPPEQTEVDEAKRLSEELARKEAEISRLRAAQSAADKQAAEERRTRLELEEKTKRNAYGDDELSYWKEEALTEKRKSAELELKTEVRDMLDSEFQDLPDAVKEAVRANPVGFIGTAQDVPTAVLNISNYLARVASKNQSQVDDKPTGKEFKVPEPAPRADSTSAKPKDFSGAAKKLVESGLFG